MSKKIVLQEKILDIIQKKSGISTPEIGEIMNISRVSAYSYTKNLITENKIYQKGKGKATRYFPQKYKENTNIFLPAIQKILLEKYEEKVLEADILATFDKYCMYISSDDVIFTDFEAFVLWCRDTKHNFANRIPDKAVEYLDLAGSIEFLRRKNGFLEGTEAARSNLQGVMKVGFDTLYFCIPSVLRNGFGSTRTSIELRYGKKNGNAYLLEQAIENWIDPIRDFIIKKDIDACIFTPPTQDRRVQFRDILRKNLALKIPEIQSEKVAVFNKILEPQKDIRDKEKRVKNALQSLEVYVPKEINFYRHIVIFDDSFTTGATPNAVALKLKEAGYQGKITIITICGSFDYDLAISEAEI